MSTPSMDDTLAAGGLPVITPPDLVNDATFVYHVDLFLVALLACVVVSRLPQAIALFSSSDWYNGHFFRYVPYRRSTTIVQALKATHPPPMKGQWSEDSHSSATSHTSASSKLKRLDKHGAQIVPIYPTHIASCMRFLRPIIAPLRARIVPGYSVAQFLIMTIYFWVLTYASFYKSNLFLEADRTGWVAIAQLPFIFALSQKNNLLGWLMGVGYEKVGHFASAMTTMD
jgi:ferric-chelate reductase